MAPVSASARTHLPCTTTPPASLISMSSIGRPVPMTPRLSCSCGQSAGRGEGDFDDDQPGQGRASTDPWF
jgi:hypothetical protein